MTCACFHPLDDDVLVTFGQQHLVLWQLMPDKTGTERKTCLNVGPLTRLRATDMQLLQDSHSRSHKETVNAAVFLTDDMLLTGNSRGELVLWAPVPSDDGSLDLMQRPSYGHTVSAREPVC